MNLRTRVEEFLRSLGNTADEVAHALENVGAYGHQNDGCACPVANALRARFPEAREANGAQWAPDCGCWFVCGAYIRVPGFDPPLTTPPPVAEFIEHFDDYGNYPELRGMLR